MIDNESGMQVTRSNPQGRQNADAVARKATKKRAKEADGNEENEDPEDSTEAAVFDIEKIQTMLKEEKFQTMLKQYTNSLHTPNLIGIPSQFSSKSSVSIGIGAAIADPSNPKRLKNEDKMVRKGLRDFIREELYSDMKFVRDDGMAKTIVRMAVEEGGLVVPFGVKTLQEFAATYFNSVYQSYASVRHNGQTLARRHYIGEIDTSLQFRNGSKT